MSKLLKVAVTTAPTVKPMVSRTRARVRKWTGEMSSGEARMEEVFVVAFHALDGGVDDFDVGAVLLEDAATDALDGGLAGLGVADDAALADVFAAGFELRLDEDDGFALPGTIWGAECAEDGGEDESRGDERDIHCEKGGSWLCGCQEFAGCEQAGVGALEEGDARIVAELLGDLTVASVYSEDRFRAILEHAIGEAAGGGAYIDAGEADERDRPVGEGVLEFEAAATDVLEIGAEEADRCSGGDGGAGLVDALLVDEDAAGEDESLGAFARSGVTAVDKKFVEARLFGADLFSADFFLMVFCSGHHFSGSCRRAEVDRG